MLSRCCESDVTIAGSEYQYYQCETCQLECSLRIMEGEATSSLGTAATLDSTPSTK